jgi:hypothetical protein
VIAGLPAVGSCASEPEPGEYGTFRYFGQVRGPLPLALFPPISDREGNVYVLKGGLEDFETQVFVGHSGGGWSGGCGLTEGVETGAHGWVGFAENLAFYWSGGALVEVSGRSGGCRRVLETDPASGARLDFRAVIPWVRDTPSRTTALAWIQSPTDSVPFQVVVDLDTRVYTASSRFSPSSASGVTVLGVGGDGEAGEGVVVVRYTTGDTVRHQARFIDADGETVEAVNVSGLDELPPYGIVGNIEAGPNGLYVGLGADGLLLILDKSGGKRREVSGMTPVGVHRWEGELFVVGVHNSSPRIAAIDVDGKVGKAQKWDSSSAAASGLKGTITVVDDRTLPSTDRDWKNPVSAMGPAPLVHPYSLDHYADGTTTWLVAGPSFTAGGEPIFAVAFVPVGVSYP